MASKLIQIYYKDEQKTACYPFSDLHFNDKLTIFFENTPISRFVMEAKEDKIGVCSWKLREKMKYNVCRPRVLTEEVINSDYDVLSFTCNTRNHRMLEAADRWHAGFRVAINKIVESIGSRCPGDVKIPIYQNAFMAKREIYQDYVKKWLNPAMELMIKDSEMNKIAMIDSRYTQLAKKEAASFEYLKNQIGVPYYPMAPFLLERLFSIYVHNNKINVTWL